MLHFLNDHFSTNNVNIFQMFSLALTITLGNNGVGITYNRKISEDSKHFRMKFRLFVAQCTVMVKTNTPTLMWSKIIL